jgi:hypothetical protein
MQKWYLMKLFQESGVGMKDSSEGGEFKCDIFDTS